MPKYKVEITTTKTETYHVEAVDASEAEELVFIDGVLVDETEDACLCTGVNLIEPMPDA